VSIPDQMVWLLNSHNIARYLGLFKRDIFLDRLPVSSVMIVMI